MSADEVDDYLQALEDPKRSTLQMLRRRILGRYRPNVRIKPRARGESPSIS